MRLYFASVLLFVTACSEVPNGDAIEQVESVESRIGQSRIEQVQGEESCLQECGRQARSGFYTDCLENGGDQKECGRTAREWYRDCLHAECSEADVQLDDCRIDCRVEAKSSYEQCLTNHDKSECHTIKKEEIDSCLLDCNHELKK